MANAQFIPTFWSVDDVSPANALDRIDLTTEAATKIFDDGDIPPSGATRFIMGFSVMVDEVVSPGDNAVISLGTNNPDYDNLVEAYAVSNIEGRADIIPIRDPRGISGTDIFVNVKRASGASTHNTWVAVKVASLL